VPVPDRWRWVGSVAARRKTKATAEELTEAELKQKCGYRYRDGTVCGRPRKDGHDPCPFCAGPVEHHERDDEDLERQGRTRMAAARRAAGVPLDATDKKVLDGGR
jgi:hypothetical protein